MSEAQPRSNECSRAAAKEFLDRYGECWAHAHDLTARGIDPHTIAMVIAEADQIHAHAVTARRRLTEAGAAAELLGAVEDAETAFRGLYLAAKPEHDAKSESLWLAAMTLVVDKLRDAAGLSEYGRAVSEAGKPANEKPPPADNGAEQPKGKSKPPCHEKALQSYEYASRVKPELVNGDGPNYKGVYKWLKEHGCEGYTLPPFESWARYVRGGQQDLSNPKHSSRGNRTGRSIVGPDGADTTIPD